MQSLQQAYEIEIQVPVKYKNIPPDIAFTQTPPDVISVKVKDKGSVLLNYSLGRSFSPLEADMKAQQQAGRLAVSQAEIESCIKKQLIATTSLIQFEPQAIDISYSKRGKSVFPPGVAVSLNLSDSATILKGRTQSDSLGRWSFTIEDFYGEKKACLATLKYLPENRKPWLRTHKWFSPVPRQYAADELHLPAAANTTYAIRTDDIQRNSAAGKSRTLRQVDVTAKLPRQRWRNTTRSVVHYSYAEEKEYILDTSIGLPATTTLVVGTLLHRYYYPFRPFRTIIIDRYEGDHTVPEGKCNDNPWIEIDSIKEVVIRTDHAAIQRYDYDNERIKKFTYGGMGNTTGGGPTLAGVILDDGYPFYPPSPGDTQGRHRDMYAPEPPLCYSAFLVKYTPEEIKGHPE